MGYYVDISEYDIRIKKENFENAYKAMCELNKRDDLKNGGGGANEYNVGWNDPRPEGLDYHPAKWFSWMDANYPATCKTMEDILHSLGFEMLKYDDNGDLIGFYYSSKIGAEDYFFNAIAEYIEPKSFVNWRGEDGESWQWYFDNGVMTIRVGKTVYE